MGSCWVSGNCAQLPALAAFLHGSLLRFSSPFSCCSLPAAGALRRKQRKKEETDDLDKLSRAYLQKFFSDAPAGPKAGKGGAKGGKGAAKGAAAAAPTAAAMKRWFD